MYKLLALIALVVTLLPSLSATAADDALTLAYVDTERVLQGSLEFKEIDRESRLKISLKEEEGQKMLDQLRKFEEELTVLSEDKREEMMSEYMRRREELLDFQEQAREEILDRQSVDLKRIAAKVKKVIEALSRELGVALVLDVKPVLYLDPTKVTDLSDRVITRLNAEYEKEQERLQRKAPTRVQ